MNDSVKAKKETAKLQMMCAHWGTKGLLKRYGEYAKDGTKISYKDTFSLCLKKTKELWGKNLSMVRITAILDGREKEFYTEEDVQAEFAKQPLKEAAIKAMGDDYRKYRREESMELEDIIDDSSDEDDLCLDFIHHEEIKDDFRQHAP